MYAKLIFNKLNSGVHEKMEAVICEESNSASSDEEYYEVEKIVDHKYEVCVQINILKVVVKCKFCM